MPKVYIIMGGCVKNGTKKNIQTTNPTKITNSFSMTPNFQLMGNNLFIIATRLSKLSNTSRS